MHVSAAGYRYMPDKSARSRNGVYEFCEDEIPDQGLSPFFTDGVLVVEDLVAFVGCHRQHSMTFAICAMHEGARSSASRGQPTSISMRRLRVRIFRTMSESGDAKPRASRSSSRYRAPLLNAVESPGCDNLAASKPRVSPLVQLL